MVGRLRTVGRSFNSAVNTSETCWSAPQERWARNSPLGHTCAMTRSLQEILDEIALLVEHGEYLDVIPGHPQEGTSGGGAYRQLPDGRLQKEYFRGTPEYEQARSAGELAFLPPLTRGVATPATINAVERLVGEPVPPLLRRLYEEVANGGFGPGYGILGLGDGGELAGGDTAPELFASRSEWWPPSAPTSLVALCDWGCAVQSFVDWSDPTGPIWGLDPNPVGSTPGTGDAPRTMRSRRRWRKRSEWQVARPGVSKTQRVPPPEGGTPRFLVRSFGVRQTSYPKCTTSPVRCNC